MLIYDYSFSLRENYERSELTKSNRYGEIAAEPDITTLKYKAASQQLQTFFRMTTTLQVITNWSISRDRS